METQSEAPELSGSPSASRTRSKRKADDTIKEETSLLPAHKPKKQRAPRKAKVIPPSAGSGHINYDPNMPVYIGTSGYSYANWKEKYYPKGVDQMEFYLRDYQAVEINNSFYRVPLDEHFIGWQKKVESIRPGIRLAIKANQYFTHMKQLKVDEDFVSRWQDFWRKCQLLGPTLGPILFQLPHKIRKTDVTLARLIAVGELTSTVSKEAKLVWEFRDSRWYCEEVYNVLRKYDWALSTIDIYHRPGTQKPWCGDLPTGTHPPLQAHPETCTWGRYFRFHGTTGQYEGSYSPEILRRFAVEIKQWMREHPAGEVWAMFNNTDNEWPSSAIVDSRELAKQLRLLGLLRDEVKVEVKAEGSVADSYKHMRGADSEELVHGIKSEE